MASPPEFSDLQSEIDKVHKIIIQYELMIDAIRKVISKGVLTSEEEEDVILALYPSEIGHREMDTLLFTLGISDETKIHIPALKGLVEKELNGTYDLIQQLESATSFINSCELDIPAKVAELQENAEALSGDVHHLYKQLKTLLGLHSTERTSCLKTRFESLSLKAAEVADNSRDLEDTILKNIFLEATDEQLADIVKDLELELPLVTERCDMKEKQLEQFESQKAELLPLADSLRRLDEEIALKKIALEAFSDYC